MATFWTWLDDETLVVEHGATSIILRKDHLTELVTEYLDGLCPVCFNPKNVGQVVCSDCAEDVLAQIERECPRERW